MIGSEQRLNENIVQETLEKYESYVNPALAKLFRLMGLGTIGVQAEGMYVEDIYGTKYLDCLGNFGVLNLGHRHPKVIEAVTEQLNRLPISARFLLDKSTADLAETIAKYAPGNLQYTFFCNSGAEAVEGALKMARAYTRKPGVISTKGGFHGKTFGALSATGREVFREPFYPLLEHFKQVPFGDIQALKEAIDVSTGAVILEPIQGEGGIIVPPEDYLSQVREICNQNKILLIFDEVQSGMGRTGKMFASEHWDVAPDIMCLAKALGGGVMPIGCFTAIPEVWEAFIDSPFIHSSTFGGSPLACSAALATFRVLVEENLIEQGAKKGEYFLSKMKDFQKKYSQAVVDVRGKGLMIGIEVAKDGIGGLMINDMVSNNILAGYTLNNPKVIRLEPPLIITEEQIDYVVKVIEKSLQTAIEMIDEF